jgi:hypothetical protein
MVHVFVIYNTPDARTVKPDSASLTLHVIPSARIRGGPQGKRACWEQATQPAYLLVHAFAT